MAAQLVKEEEHKIIDNLSSDATRDDLMHELHVREVIDRGVADSVAGRTTDVSDIRARYGLPQ